MAFFAFPIPCPFLLGRTYFRSIAAARVLSPQGTDLLWFPRPAWQALVLRQDGDAEDFLHRLPTERAAAAGSENLQGASGAEAGVMAREHHGSGLGCKTDHAIFHGVFFSSFLELQAGGICGGTNISTGKFNTGVSSPPWRL